jgi:hypothetical protein
MDGDMKRQGKRQKAKMERQKARLRAYFYLLPFAFCLLPCPSTGFAAELLPDPTQPPPEAALVAGPAPVGPVLQSVMIAPGRRTAVIGGQLLKEGDSFGDTKLVRISQGEVVLSGPGGEQTLKLFPAVEKTLVHVPRSGSPEPAPHRETPKRSLERKVP